MKTRDIARPGPRSAVRTASGTGSASPRWVARHRSRCAGQAILESALVIILGCLLTFGVLQIAQLMIAKGVLTYAAAAGARAKSVGFNDFMVEKVVQVAAIPTAGAMTYPGQTGGSLALQLDTEMAAIPLYLDSARQGRLQGILQYERWPDLRSQESGAGSALAHVRAEQDIPLVFPFHRAFYWADTVLIQSGEASRNHLISRGRHADLYLE